MAMEFPVDADAALTFFAAGDRSLLDPRRRASWEVGDVLREIIDRLVDTRAGTDDLSAITAELELVAARLRQFDHGRRYDSYGEAANASMPATGAAGSDETTADETTADETAADETAADDAAPPSGHADFSPLLGRANPLAPPMEFSIDSSGDVPKVCADVTFGHAYEGPPGHVHGGIVAAAFDELLGATQAMSGSPGMTANLGVNYRAPTPLHVPLHFESTLDSVEGRKIRTSGRLFNGDVLCAESTGLFISIDFSAIAAMRVDRDGSQKD
jgi:acyl-coenzyme A thioesterase PaaI-like protein